MRYYIVVGESSGDMHGANLIKALKIADVQAVFAGAGGDKMAAEGCDLGLHINSMDFMGFVEVLKHLPQIKRNFLVVEKHIASFAPDVVIFIDYPGFNLRMLQKIAHLSVKKVYYIAPQLWAWKKARIEILKKYCHQVLVILPFEKDFYAQNGLQVGYVGHPLLDEIKRQNHSAIHKMGEKKVIALLPGSRKQEINKLLPIYLNVARLFPDYVFKIAGLERFGLAYYEGFGLGKNVVVEFNNTQNILAQSNFALVTSGTATLEAALFKTPQIVCYKLHWLSYQIGKRLAKVAYFSLVNLIMDKKVVEELLQDTCNVEAIAGYMQSFFANEAMQKNMEANYELLSNKLGEGGAAQKAAKAIVGLF